jgi:hypothetical protein
MRWAASVFGRPLAQPGSSAGGCWAVAVMAAQSTAAAAQNERVFGMAMSPFLRF